MSRRTIPIVVALAGLAGLLAWILIPTGSTGRESAPGAETPSPAPTTGADPVASAPAPVDLDAPDITPLGDEERGRAALEAATRRDALREDASAKWIEGTVVLPPGLPGDERILALVVAHEMRSGRLYAKSGPGPTAWRGDEQCHGLIDWGEVDANGGFRIAVPEDTHEAHVAVTGRYVYSRVTTRVDAPASGVVIAAELGAWVTGRLVAPLDATSEEADLEGVEVELGPDITAGFNPMDVQELGGSPELETDAAGQFEFRGVPTTVGRGIVARPERLAAVRVLGLKPEPGEHLELEVPLTRGATLAGRVVTDAGAPLAEVDVGARYPGALGRGIGDLRETETDEEGLFVLENVATGKLELSGRHPEYRAGKLKLEESEVQEGSSLSGLEIVLETGGVISGIVRFADGAPAEEANVRATPDLSQLGGMEAVGIDWESSGSATTDAEGRFEMRGLSANRMQLTAKKTIDEGPNKGTWSSILRDVQSDGEPITLVLESLLGLHGAVSDLNGVPVPSFDVRATLKGTGGMFGIGAETLSFSFQDEEEGNFEADGFRPGVWEVKVSAAGYATTDALDVTLPQPAANPALFELQPDAGISGNVYDTTGAPVSNAKVTLKQDLASRLDFSGETPSAYSDALGAFRLEGLDPGSIELVASLTGYAESEALGCSVAAGEVLEGVKLHLRLGGTLKGEILDDEGEPAAGRMIIVQKTPDFSAQHMLRSDANGAFEAEHLAPGKWQVVATADFLGDDMSDAENSEDAMASLLGDMKMDIVDIVDGEVTHVLLGAPPEDPVHVRGVVTHGDEPVASAVVSFLPEEAEGVSAMKIEFTKNDGTFELDLDHPGPYLVTVQRASSTGQQNSIEYQERIAEGEEEVSLQYGLPLGMISGRVRGADGAPAAGARVTLSVEGGQVFGSVLGGHYTETTTDDEGYYEIDYLRPGTYTVAAGGLAFGGLLGGEAIGGRVLKSGLEVDEDQHLSGIDFRLEEPGAIKGKVLDSAGLAVQGATVFVRDEDGRLLERFSFLTTDANGEFTYDGLSPGRYSVLAKSNELASRDSTLVRVPAGGHGEATVQLEPGTIVIVSVTDRSNEQVRARIKVVDPDGRTFEGIVSLEEMMELGMGFSTKEQRFGPLPPGQYKVTATTEDGRSTTKPVTLRGTGERKLKIRLK